MPASSSGVYSVCISIDRLGARCVGARSLGSLDHPRQELPHGVRVTRVVAKPVAVRHDDELVVRRHPELLEPGDVGRLSRLKLENRPLDVEIGTDDGVHLPCQEGGDKIEADIDAADVVLAQPLLPADRLQDGVVERQSRDADRRARQRARPAHLGIREGDQRVQRRRDERSDGDDGQTLLRREEQIALVVHGQVEGVRRDQLEPGRGIRRRSELDIEAAIGEVAAVERVVQRDMIGVGEPVERDLDRLGRRTLLRRTAAAARDCGCDDSERGDGRGTPQGPRQEGIASSRRAHGTRSLLGQHDEPEQHESQRGDHRDRREDERRVEPALCLDELPAQPGVGARPFAENGPDGGVRRRDPDAGKDLRQRRWELDAPQDVESRRVECQHHPCVLGVDRPEPVDCCNDDGEEAEERDDREFRPDVETEREHEHGSEDDRRNALRRDQDGIDGPSGATPQVQGDPDGDSCDQRDQEAERDLSEGDDRCGRRADRLRHAMSLR